MNKSLLKIVGGNIRHHREGKALGRDELGFDRGYVRRVEEGLENLTLIQVGKFAAALRLDSVELFRVREK